MIRVLSAAFGAVLLAAPSLVAAQQARPAAVAPATTPASSAPAAAHAVQSYASEAEAKPHCAGDIVVWGNPRSKVYHFAGSKSYGKTKRGAYMCRKEGDTDGYHAARGEKAPAVN